MKLRKIKILISSIDGLIWFYITLFCITVLLLNITYKFWPDGSNSWLDNVRVEVVGFCFDVLLLGLVFSIMMKRYQKKQDIRRWMEEIEDFRGWDDKEAMYRNVGNIKRLNRLGISRMYLKKSFLKGAYLESVDMQKSYLTDANFEGAYLGFSKFNNADCSGVNFSEAKLYGCNFENANLINAVFKSARMVGDIDMKAFNKEDWGCYPFFDGAIVSDETWVNFLKYYRITGHEILENVYTVKKESSSFVICVKPEKREEYDLFKYYCSLDNLVESSYLITKLFFTTYTNKDS